ncbi:hypothetical protein ABZP36_003621 [Zizania latifolia]
MSRAEEGRSPPAVARCPSTSPSRPPPPPVQILASPVVELFSPSPSSPVEAPTPLSLFELIGLSEESDASPPPARSPCVRPGSPAKANADLPSDQCTEQVRCWCCNTSGHISTNCVFNARPAFKSLTSSFRHFPSPLRNHSPTANPTSPSPPTKEPPAAMAARRPECAELGTANTRPTEDFCYIAAIEKIDDKVGRLSNHSLVAWEIDIPPDREKADINQFADDFKIFFGVNHMRFQVTRYFPEDYLVTLSDTTIREDSHILLLDAVSQGNTVAITDDFHHRLEEFLSQVAAALPQPIMPTPPKVQRTSKEKNYPTVSRRSSRLATKNPAGKGLTALALEVLSKKLGLADSSPENTSRKLASLFKQPVSLAAVRAIRELVSCGGGQALLHGNDKIATTSSPQQPAI